MSGQGNLRTPGPHLAASKHQAAGSNRARLSLADTAVVRWAGHAPAPSSLRESSGAGESSRLAEAASHPSELTHSLHSCFSSSLGTLEAASNSPSASCDPTSSHCINLSSNLRWRSSSGPPRSCVVSLRRAGSQSHISRHLPADSKNPEGENYRSIFAVSPLAPRVTLLSTIQQESSSMPPRNHKVVPPPQNAPFGMCTDKTYFHHNTIFSGSINP